MFGIMNKMTPSDKVKVCAFSVCGSWVLGAHMTYCANFQPNLLAIVMIGKFLAGCLAVLFPKMFIRMMGLRSKILSLKFKH